MTPGATGLTPRTPLIVVVAGWSFIALVWMVLFVFAFELGVFGVTGD
jgi:hypothetical protein